MSSECVKDELLDRCEIYAQQVQGAPEADKSGIFTVVTYNILSETIRKMYKDYNEYTDEKFLDIKYRHARIIQELRYLDPDIICLQEVDKVYYDETLLNEMYSLGYEGVYLQKNDEFGEGEATFYRTNVFDLVDNREYAYSELAIQDINASDNSEEVRQALRSHVNRPAVIIISTLLHKLTGKRVVIGNTHLTWTKFTDLDISCIQVGYAFKSLDEATNHGEIPYLICGDFNSRVTDPAYQLAIDGSLNDTSMKMLLDLNTVKLQNGQRKPLIELMKCAFQHPSNQVISAYRNVLGGEPACTSRNFLMDHGVDYMMSRSLGIVSVADVNRNVPYLPSELYPSDHLSLKSVYAFI